MFLMQFWVSLGFVLSLFTPVGASGAEPGKVLYGKEEIDVSHRINRGEYLIRKFIDETDGSMVWLDHSLKGSFLKRTPKNGATWDDSKTQEVFNFGKRSFWVPMFNKKDRQLYVLSDDQNDETFNAYRVNFKAGTLDKLTDFQYQPQFNFSADDDTLLSVGRQVKSGSDACLKETSLKDGAATTLFCNTADQHLYPFGEVKEDPKSGLIAFTVTHKGDRSTKNLALMKRGDKHIQVVTPDSVKRVTLDVLGWREGGLYFIANDGSADPELRLYTPKDGKTEVLVKGGGFTTMDGFFDDREPRIFLVRRTSDDKKGEATVFNLVTELSESFDTSELDLFLGWATPVGDGTLAVSGKSRKDSTRLIVFHWDPKAKPVDQIKIAFEKTVQAPPPPACDGKIIEYPTFDQDPATGKTRMINAVLFTPRKSRGGAPAALVYAHGGPSGKTTPAASNEVDFLCSLGYTVLGPNPRGSSGQGQEFEDLNNGDWGGGDWKDYEYGRRYLETVEKISADRIGITGASFGGYMTNWAMTRPDNQFAFGISDFGMADLLYQMQWSVVPDNTKSDMGDPVAKEALYRERSPMHYAKNIRKPFLITMGSRDFRVYFDDARRFAAELKKYSSEVRYLELQGEGHGYRYPDTLTEYYTALAKFLYEVAPVGP